MKKETYCYNFCAGEPQVDRTLLNINAQDNLYLLTFNGDNVFEYLLDNPHSIHCVAHSYVLELKMACMTVLNQADFFQVFAKNNNAILNQHYEEISSHLSPDAQEFWQKTSPSKLSATVPELCSFEYMNSDNYDLVKAQLHKIKIHTDLFEECSALIEKPGCFSKIILLDYMDTLDEVSIQKCWSNFKKYANPNAHYLWCSHDEKMAIECLQGLNFFISQTIQSITSLPIDRIQGSVHLAQIPAELIFNASLASKAFKRSVLEDIKTQLTMVAHIFMKKDDEFMDNYYKKQAHYYDNYRSRMLHGKAQLLNKLTFKTGMRVLVQGIGTGDILDTLETIIPSLKELVLIDIADVMLAQCRQRVTNKGWTNVVIEQADACAYVRPDHFDLIICTYTLTMIKNWSMVVTNAHLSLKKQGIYAVTDFTSKKKTGFYPWIFKLNHVFMNPEHFQMLKQRFHSRYFTIKKGGFPLLHRWIRCSYYVGIFEKRS